MSVIYNHNDKVKIKDKPLVREMGSKGIMSTDLQGLKAYKDRQKSANDINNIRKEMNEIKELLLKLFKEKKKDE